MHPTPKNSTRRQSIGQRFYVIAAPAPAPRVFMDEVTYWTYKRKRKESGEEYTGGVELKCSVSLVRETEATKRILKFEILKFENKYNRALSNLSSSPNSLAIRLYFSRKSFLLSYVRASSNSEWRYSHSPTINTRFCFQNLG